MLLATSSANRSWRSKDSPRFSRRLSRKGPLNTIMLSALTGKARLDGKKREAVFIDVEDTGPGIHESIERRLFHPFFSTKSHGIGLGLATAARIVSKHHGAIEFKTKLGQGTTFT